MKTITIDRNVRLAEDPGTGHNRWHPAISPVAEVEPGEEIAVQTRDALDGQLSPSSTEVDLARTSLNPVHPLTGPIYIKGARAGDPEMIVMPSSLSCPTVAESGTACRRKFLRK